MIIKVGSMNPTKIDAVKEAFQSYEQYKDAEVLGVEVSVEEFGHPKGMEAIAKGAMDRAKQAFLDCNFSVGIVEAGLCPCLILKQDLWKLLFALFMTGKISI